MAELQDSAPGRLLLEAVVAVKDANLPEIPAANITIAKRAWWPGAADEVVFPACLVSPVDGPIEFATNLAVDDSYGVMITLATPSNQELVDGLGLVLKWHELLRQRFHDQLDWCRKADSKFWTSKVQGATWQMQRAFQEWNCDAQFVSVRCTLRATRPTY